MLSSMFLLFFLENRARISGGSEEGAGDGGKPSPSEISVLLILYRILVFPII